LTELRPGKATPQANAAPIAAARQAKLPPRDAVVDARELGTLALASHGRARGDGDDPRTG